MRLQYWLQKNAEELDKKNSGSGSWHSTFYQSYFAGYTEFYVKKPDGTGRKLERIYTGTYYSQALSNNLRVLIRLLYFVLFVVGVTLFILGANGAGDTWYVVLCIASVFPLAFLTLVSLVYYLFAHREMKQYEYQRATDLKKYTLAAALLLFVAAIMTFVSTFQIALSSVPWTSVALLFSSGLCMTGITVVERHIQYNKRLSQEEVPPGGIEMG